MVGPLTPSHLFTLSLILTSLINFLGLLLATLPSRQAPRPTMARALSTGDNSQELGFCRDLQILSLVVRLSSAASNLAPVNKKGRRRDLISMFFSSAARDTVGREGVQTERLFFTRRECDVKGGWVPLSSSLVNMYFWGDY